MMREEIFILIFTTRTQREATEENENNCGDAATNASLQDAAESHLRRAKVHQS